MADWGWTAAAAGVALLHVGYLVYQQLGALLGLRDRRWLRLHLLAVAWGVGIVVVQGSCPLTLLEKALRAQAGSGYTASFLDHYVFGSVLPDGWQPWVYAAHLAGIAATYAAVLRRPAGGGG